MSPNKLRRKPKKTKGGGLSLGKPRVKVSKRPASNRPIRKKPNKISSFFKRKKTSGTNSRAVKARKKQNYTIFLKYLGLFILGVIVIFTFYNGIKWIINTRTSKTALDSGIYQPVVGFSDIPQYPLSEYVFADVNTETNTVKEFQASGRSIYRLARGGSVDGAIEFYKEHLPKDKWTHVLSVSRTSTESLYGEYWVNTESNYGLRLYDRVNDIWYERISVEEAKSGLAEQLSAQIERELIISAGDGIDLLPDYPWQLTVPKEYVVSYFPTDEGDLRGVAFTEIGTSNKYTLEPISPLDGSLDDLYLEHYVSILNTRASLDDEQESWNILNSSYANVGGKTVLIGSIISKENAAVYILQNEKVQYAYAFLQETDDATFTNFLVRNMSVKNSDYTGTEYDLDD